MTIFGELEELFATAAAHVSQLDGRFLLPALALQLANLALRSLAWRNVIAAAHTSAPVPTFRIMGAYLAGLGLNSFTPARGGDVAKVVLARTQLPGSTLPMLASTLGVLVAFDLVLGTSLFVVFALLGLMPALPAAPAVGVVPAVAAFAVVAGGVAFRLARPTAARRIRAEVLRGFAIVRSARRYGATVLPLQLAAWCCRVAVVLLVLGAFRIHVGPETAALVVVLNGLSTIVPIPGGAGAQQVLTAYALQGTAPIAGALTFSIGLQAGITAVNVVVAIVAAMLLLRTMRPLAALRSAAASVHGR